MSIWIIALFLSVLQLAVSEDLLVPTSNGLIKGRVELTEFTNRTYFAFYGVRYAQPPVGSLRFQAPVPAEPWSDTYDATYEKNYCFQVTTDSEGENEDCLFLNVFSSKKPEQGSLVPVMFFVHGGGFKEGSGLVNAGYGPEFFMDYNVVLVSINYRLGPFGFLATSDGIIPGNAGLKDVHQALQWVHENIEFFGGDPEKVTIFGNSAGSACVSYQLLHPQSQGLFRAAILQSGTALNPWAYQRDQEWISFRTAAYMNEKFNSSEQLNSSELLEFLLGADARDIDAASKSLSNTESTANLQIQQGFYYGPVIERHENSPFLTTLPYEGLKNGDYLQVPIMIGTTAEEGLSMLTDYFHWTLADYDSNLKLLVPAGLHISDENLQAEVGALIKQEYTPDAQFQDNILAGIQFHSDQDFSKSLIKDAKLQSSRAPVYFYEFTYHGAMGDFPQELMGAGNVSHGEDQNYIFNRVMWYSQLNNADLSQFSEQDQTVHYRYLKLLVNFATYLDPTPEDDDLLQNIHWPVVQADNFQYLEIGTNLSVGKNPKGDRQLFWEHIFTTYGLEPFETF
ncbi:juvenile hormone esterase [Dendroctonus ponderosae]|uniref:juvenile hormone esterase n=1 Tax=Dendroctonus ponderosae TaxID=77166 RepID=UPI0020366021|nr:juvenile hormone esterase [Dendroctonus ponderosae]